MECLEPSAVISSSDQDFSWPVIAQPQPRWHGGRGGGREWGGGAGDRGGGWKPLLQEVLALIQCVVGLYWSRSVWTTRDHVSPSRKDREKNPGNPQGERDFQICCEGEVLC